MHVICARGPSPKVDVSKGTWGHIQESDRKCNLVYLRNMLLLLKYSRCCWLADCGLLLLLYCQLSMRSMREDFYPGIQSQGPHEDTYRRTTVSTAQCALVFCCCCWIRLVALDLIVDDCCFYDVSYPCEVCQKTFTRASSLKSHMRTHKEEQP